MKIAPDVSIEDPHVVGVRTSKRDTCLSSTMYGFALVQLVFLDRKWLKPEKYLSAAGEMLGIILLVCTALTAIFHPEDFDQNALVERFGYSNFCVVFDTTPGSYFAAPLLSVVSYLNIRYVTSDHVRSSELLRTKRMSLAQYRLSRTANVMFGIGGGLLPVLLVFPPSQNFWIHFGIFLLFAVTQWFCFLANVIEARSSGGVTLRTQVYTSLYSIVTFLFCTLSIVTALDYDWRRPWSTP